jgi:hypothetical protein
MLGGQMMLVQEITVTAGGATLFHKVYGNKAGLEPTVTCTAVVPDGPTIEVELVAVH